MPPLTECAIFDDGFLLLIERFFTLLWRHGRLGKKKGLGEREGQKKNKHVSACTLRSSLSLRWLFPCHRADLFAAANELCDCWRKKRAFSPGATRKGGTDAKREWSDRGRQERESGMRNEINAGGAWKVAGNEKTGRLRRALRQKCAKKLLVLGKAKNTTSNDVIATKN